MKKLLIDSHALVWFARADRRIGKAAFAALIDPEREVCVSAVSYWELEVKQQRSSEFLLPEPLQDFMERADFAPLELQFEVPAQVRDLPDVHDDPFDRLLVAQALHHDLVLVTNDRMIRRYPVETLW